MTGTRLAADTFPLVRAHRRAVDLNPTTAMRRVSKNILGGKRKKNAHLKRSTANVELAINLKEVLGAGAKLRFVTSPITAIADTSEPGPSWRTQLAPNLHSHPLSQLPPLCQLYFYWMLRALLNAHSVTPHAVCPQKATSISPTSTLVCLASLVAASPPSLCPSSIFRL